MFLSTIIAVVWLMRNRLAPDVNRAKMMLGLAFNALMPVLGYLLMLKFASIP